ncbi:bidirectional sugar transporter SWEET14-like, partial [Dendrobium catenatum]|uniref:bidirectional sugar transporter SWEET14-like n=1 Tax=Dendrobium catenatum TaxID=906689 RepID=UPI0009F24289
NLISFMVFLAPVTIFYRIYKRKSTEGFRSVRYVIAHFNCMLWVYYAYIKTDEILHITNNAFGLLVESVYIVIYLIYAPLRAKKLTAAIVIFLNVTVFGVIVAITLLLFHGQKILNILGWICVGFSVIFFAAPLSIM